MRQALAPWRVSANNGRMDAVQILVTEFDGTLTRHDFYALAASQLLPPDAPELWRDYRTGRLTHFAALQGYFAAIRADQAAVDRVLTHMQLEPNLAAAVAALEAAGWKVIVASAGCRWYIDRLLAHAGVALEVHANPGRFEPGSGLRMELPQQSPFFSPTHGIDKAKIVRHYRVAGARVAFAGDGFPDVEAARLVPPRLRFARGDLAQVLRRQGESFQPFASWSEIAAALAGPLRHR
jgi:2,3-diketo-5-methylthio-1-phosphopentane phosphatase